MLRRYLLTLSALATLFIPLSSSIGATVVVDNYGYGASFSPTQIADLSSWYDAADASSITHTSNAVDQWNDKSGNGYNATATTTARPTTNTRTLNGLNVIDFDATTDTMSVSNSVISYAAQTVISVAIPDTTTTSIYVFGNTGTGGSLNRFYQMNQSGDAGNTPLARVSPTSGTAIIQVLRVDGTGGTTQYVKINNDSELSGSVTRAGLAAGNRIGSYGNGLSGFYDGGIAELLIYKRKLTAAEVNQIAAYLVAKWALTWSDL